MTRSLEELRSEAELNRAQLAATVDQLKVRITDTAEDIRYKVSPEGIKSEVSDFVSRKTQGWLDALKEQAMENPMQAIAAGTAVAVPALRLARGFPLPLLLIGAGLVLSSKTMRARAAEVAAPGIDKAKEMASHTAERARSLGQQLSDAASSTGSQAADMVTDTQEKAAGFADSLRDRTSQTADHIGNKVWAGLDAAPGTAKDTIERTRSTAADTITAAPETARQVIRDNAALIGGLGVAIGAIIAASLPDSNAEAAVIGKASAGVKRAAGAAAQTGFEQAKDAVLSATDAAAKSVSAADLGEHASRMTRDMAERLREAADGVVTAAFDPSRKSNN
jgi:hypothetical protein